jgi:hypothetical protein
MGMVSTENSPKKQPAEEKLKGACPYCLSEIDVHLDVKGRPYWRCWRCEVRSFATKTAHRSLETSGWIWSDERPLEALKAWLQRLMCETELSKGKKK